jgi:hypothetical protein
MGKRNESAPFAEEARKADVRHWQASASMPLLFGN